MLTDGRTDGQKSMFFLYYIDWCDDVFKCFGNMNNTVEGSYLLLPLLLLQQPLRTNASSMSGKWDQQYPFLSCRGNRAQLEQQYHIGQIK